MARTDVSDASTQVSVAWYALDLVCSQLTFFSLNIVDRVLESCFQLLSLFFMTIGRTSEAPAAYALTSTIRRLLDHLTEANLYSAKDLESITHTLERLTSIVHNPDSNSSPYLTELMVHRVDQCKVSINKLQDKLQKLEKPLPAVHEKLISILRSMSLANTKPRVCLYCVPSLLKLGQVIC